MEKLFEFIYGEARGFFPTPIISLTESSYSAKEPGIPNRAIELKLDFPRHWCGPNIIDGYHLFSGIETDVMALLELDTQRQLGFTTVRVLTPGMHFFPYWRLEPAKHDDASLALDLPEKAILNIPRCVSYKSFNEWDDRNLLTPALATEFSKLGFTIRESSYADGEVHSTDKSGAKIIFRPYDHQRHYVADNCAIYLQREPFVTLHKDVTTLDENDIHGLLRRMSWLVDEDIICCVPELKMVGTEFEITSKCKVPIIKKGSKSYIFADPLDVP
jgi:hypothetical protein